MIHELKVNDVYWGPLESGQKTFEVRRDDRGFQKGDTLALKKWGANWLSKRPGYLKGNSSAVAHEADTLYFEVLWVLTGGQFGIEPGFVVMAISPAEPPGDTP